MLEVSILAYLIENGCLEALMAKDKESFESVLGKLETVVANLESGDLPLEEALKYFEQGVSLSRECANRLNHVESRIEEILSDGRIEPLKVD
jgi:exodeoxyribonuclease VII small subunit